ncbi:hypothetical protein TNCV_3352261 [Trichonephila clavipes]|nr:hypothetical protein TNCV_3352261 [Trichonephila clavipes]
MQGHMLKLSDALSQWYSGGAVKAMAPGGIRKGVVPSSAIFKFKKYFKLQIAPTWRNLQKRMHSLIHVQTLLEAKQEEFMDDALICVKGLGEELEISFETSR